MKSFIKIIDLGLLKNVTDYCLQGDIEKKDFDKLIKIARITMVAKVNRLQSLYLCELLASYSIQSQRYCRYSGDIEKDVIFENLELFSDDEKLLIDVAIKDMTNLYLNMSELKEGSEEKAKYTIDDFANNIHIDDARYILPLAYTCNKEFTVNGEEFIKLLALLNDVPDMGVELIDLLTNDLIDLIGEEATSVLIDYSHNYKGSTRVVDSQFFDIIAKRNDMSNVHLLDNSCEYSAMQKSGAGAMMCTSNVEDPMDLFDATEDKQRSISERVAGKMKHTSIAEHASFSFLMKQSIPCYNQYVRHRHQETIREDFDMDDILLNGIPFILPESINNSKFATEIYAVLHRVEMVLHVLYKNTNREIDYDNKYRIAAMKQLIPMGFELRIICTSNLVNELYKGTKRICNNAQWEIGNITRESINIIRDKVGHDNKLIDSAKPNCCTDKGCNEGKFRCKNNSNVKELFNMV